MNPAALAIRAVIRHECRVTFSGRISRSWYDTMPWCWSWGDPESQVAAKQYRTDDW